jgi:hypothetical protein
LDHGVRDAAAAGEYLAAAPRKGDMAIATGETCLRYSRHAAPGRRTRALAPLTPNPAITVSLAAPHG